LAKIDVAEDTYLVGIGVSPGISIGEINLIDQRMTADDWPIEADQVEAELERFHWAVDQARDQLQKIKEKVSSRDHLREHLYILDTHMLILDDEMLIQGTEQVIREQVNCEGALKRTLEKLRQLFDNIEDEYLRERRSDVDAVGGRLMRILTGEHQRSVADISQKALVVAHDLSPADTMQLDRKRVLGFVTDKGGQTSHTAILARSLEIPAVVGLENITSLVYDRLPAIIDGSSGVVILNPSEETFKEYLKRKQSYEYLEKELGSFKELPAITTDNQRVALRGNLELACDFPAASKHGCEGVGLYRTEVPFMVRSELPNVESQRQLYRKVLEYAAGKPVIFRTLDIGGDKVQAHLNQGNEANPAMGWRAIRVSFDRPALLRQQLRALIRAAAGQDLSLMFPMIAEVNEFDYARRLLDKELEREIRLGGASPKSIRVGAMLEVPALLFQLQALLSRVDFVSVGTNDLIQFLFASDRANYRISEQYDVLSPVVLNLLKTVVQQGQAANVPVNLCGEMASHPLDVMALLGIGFRSISVSPPAVGPIKEIVRSLRVSSLEKFTNSLCNSSQRNVRENLKAYAKDHDIAV